MQKLLIAENDAALRDGLVDLLRRQYDITLCADGDTAVSLLESLRPDAVILDLVLPEKEGFFVLEEAAAVLPRVVLGITDFCNDYVAQTAQELGVSYLFRKPCQPRVIAGRLNHLMQYHPAPTPSDAQSVTAQILLRLYFNPKNDGFRFLKVGLPLYAQDPHQRICKELYADIATICGAGSWNQVERSIRSAIDAAWREASDSWDEYFPGAKQSPTGKTFISRISQELMDS